MKIILTGTESLSAPLAAALVEAEFEVETCPLVAIEQIGGPPVRPSDYDWLLLHDTNGVDALFARLEGPLPRVAVVGMGTAEALREPRSRAGSRRPHVDAGRSGGRAAQRPGRVLFAGAEDAREVLVRELGADFVPLERTRTASARAVPEGRSRRACLRLGSEELCGGRRRPSMRLDRPGDIRRSSTPWARRRRRGLHARPGRAPRSG